MAAQYLYLRMVGARRTSQMTQGTKVGQKSILACSKFTYYCWVCVVWCGLRAVAAGVPYALVEFKIWKH